MFTAGLAQLLAIMVVFCPIAGVSGAVEGRRCGKEGLSLGRACLRGFRRAFCSTTLAAFIMVTCVAVILAMGQKGVGGVLPLLASSLIIAPILGLLTSLLPGPMAAFLAYNFGARKRAEEELARQTRPTAER